MEIIHNQKFLKNNIKIIKQIKIKKNNIPNEFLYVYNNEKISIIFEQKKNLIITSFG